MQDQSAEPRLSNSGWFPHDNDTTTDGKIGALLSDYGAAGYGIYWHLIELMHAEPSGLLEHKKFIYKAVASRLKISAQEVENVILQGLEEYELFVKVENADGVFITSNRVQRNKERKEFIRQKRVEAGRKGGRNRQANAKQELTNSQANSKQNQADKSRVDKIRYLSTLLRTTSTELLTCLEGPATRERLLGAFASAYPRRLTTEAKDWLTETWQGYTLEQAREAVQNLAVDLDSSGPEHEFFNDLIAYLQE